MKVVGNANYVCRSGEGWWVGEGGLRGVGGVIKIEPCKKAHNSLPSPCHHDTKITALTTKLKCKNVFDV